VRSKAGMWPDTKVREAEVRVSSADASVDDHANAPYTPTPVQRKSVIHEAAEEICRLIKGTGLRTGDALPSEVRLSEMLGLSRNSVREALRMLHGVGVVEKTAGRGCIVTASSTAGWGIIDEACLLEAAEVANEVRNITMQRCVALAAKRLTDQELVDLSEAFKVLEAASTAQDRAAAKRAHDRFYGLILAGAGNALLVSMFRQADSARLTTLSWPAHKTFVAQDHLEHHRALLDALLKRDPDAASHAARKHYSALGRLIKLVVAQPGSAKQPGARGESPDPSVQPVGRKRTPYKS
jgi:GntR family transcriptional repressor for pyruvate dehydrogenase complex